MEDGIVNFGDYRKASGIGEGGGETRGLAEVPEVSRIDPKVVTQILTIRENLILSDPLGPTEQSVATANLASVIRWLEFANSGKVLKYSSFYVRVLNRLKELRPDLFEKLYNRAEVDAVRKSTQERVTDESSEGE